MIFFYNMDDDDIPPDPQNPRDWYTVIFWDDSGTMLRSLESLEDHNFVINRDYKPNKILDDILFVDFLCTTSNASRFPRLASKYNINLFAVPRDNSSDYNFFYKKIGLQRWFIEFRKPLARFQEIIKILK